MNQIVSELIGNFEMPDHDLHKLDEVIEDLKLLLIILDNDQREDSNYKEKLKVVVSSLVTRIQRVSFAFLPDSRYQKSNSDIILF